MKIRLSFFMRLRFFFICLAGMQVTAQTRSFPEFSSPLEIPLLLSGNYGEIRPAHFHAGIDIKTEQVEGKKVLSAEDGYVVRVNVQGGGYGNAIYIAHPGGFVTVYGHLREFVPEIAQYVRENQYRRKSFEVDLFPEARRFTFQKGELIGYSGNTGSSGGPHLHFEIRDQRNSVPLNALNFHLPIRDDISPKIMCLAIYPKGAAGVVDGRREKVILPVVLHNGSYMLKDGVMPQVSGDIGFGIETYDYLNGASNQCSPYTISLKVDRDPVCFLRLDSIPFDMTSYVDSHVDYEEEIRTGRAIQKLFVDPNNRLGIYKLLKNKGICVFNDSLVHQVDIEVKDAYGNESMLAFSLQSLSLGQRVEEMPADPAGVSRFAWNSLNVYENEDVRVVVPEKALYDDILFQYDRKSAPPQSISDTFYIHNIYTPLHTSYILSIRPFNLPEKLRDKVMIASTDSKGILSAYGGSYSDGYVTARMGSFGKFHLAVDTIAPVILPVSFSRDRQYAEGQKISFRIRDGESGIRRYSGYIDGEWALFIYDPKQELLTYTIDKERLNSSEDHTLEVIVTDQKDNVTHYTSGFRY